MTTPTMTRLAYSYTALATFLIFQTCIYLSAADLCYNPICTNKNPILIICNMDVLSYAPKAQDAPWENPTEYETLESQSYLHHKPADRRHQHTSKSTNQHQKVRILNSINSCMNQCCSYNAQIQVFQDTTNTREDDIPSATRAYLYKKNDWKQGSSLTKPAKRCTEAPQHRNTHTSTDKRQWTPDESTTPTPKNTRNLQSTTQATSHGP